MALPPDAPKLAGDSASLPLIGRRRELDELVGALRKRRSRLVWGGAGAGKSRLVTEALARAEQPWIRLDRAPVLHELLVELAAQLGCRLVRYPDLRRATSLSLKAAVIAKLAAVPRCIVFEDACEVGPRMYRFLRELYYIPGVCLVVTATSPGRLGHLGKLLWDPREQLALGPLSSAEAGRLFEEAARRFRLQSLDLEDLKPRILAAARGNPGRIVAMCRLAARAEYRSGGRVKFASVCIDALSSLSA